MSVTQECIHARKKYTVALILLLLGHITLGLAVVFLLVIPLLDLTWFFIILAAAVIAIIVGWYLTYKERKACWCGPDC